jgi:hypothetical protein
MGVQRAKPFAGVRGRASGGCKSGSPKNPFSFLPPEAASQQGWQEDSYPPREKSVEERGQSMESLSMDYLIYNLQSGNVDKDHSTFPAFNENI